MVETKKKFQWKDLSTILLVALLLIGFVSASGVSSNNENYQNLLTKEKLDSMLQGYFSNLNTTEIYNTYEEYITNEFYNQTFVNETYVTNEYYYYNITYLNETFNDYITNEYYEDNYYNTYNQYNQTFLNQTFIDNNYYETNNYINNSQLESMMTSINELWAMISDTQDNKIELQGQSIIDLSGNNCSRIEFMFKDSGVLSIYDTQGLGISTQIEQVNNVNFQSSFFIDNQNNVIENQMNVYYDDIKGNYNAIKVDDDNSMTLTLDNQTNLVGSELLVNFGFQEVWEWDRAEIFSIYEDNVEKFRFYQYQNKFYLKDVVNDIVTYIDSGNLGMSDKDFDIYKFKFNSNSVEFIDPQGNILTTLNSNSMNNYDSSVEIISQRDDENKEVYFRSMYINNNVLEQISAKYVVNNEEIDFNRNVWNEAQIYIMSDSILYNIGNNVVTKNYAQGETAQDYNLILNLDETSLSNLYCYD